MFSTMYTFSELIVLQLSTKARQLLGQNIGVLRKPIYSHKHYTFTYPKNVHHPYNKHYYIPTNEWISISIVKLKCLRLIEH